MTIIEIKVPMLSESVSDATILEWKKNLGENVDRNEIIVDLETDKVVLEVPSPVSGVLMEINRKSGDIVHAHEIIGKIKQQDIINNDKDKSIINKKILYEKNHKIAISPAARKLIEENKISNNLSGSGRDGRIIKNDILSLNISNKDNNNQQNTSNLTKIERSSLVNENYSYSRSEKRVPMSRLRAKIAERLIESQRTYAILTTFNEVNMDNVIEVRNKYKELFQKEYGIKLGFMFFFIKASIHALKKFPILNASIDGNDIIYHDYFDIGIAVSSPRGLIVPILRNADRISAQDIEKEISRFGQEARDNKLSIKEITGGTFSISNGGVFGSMFSTPIINPPQSAILGIHATQERPIVKNKEIVISNMNYLALSYDHRIIDGREAVLFLAAIKDALEDPTRMLLSI